MRIAAYCRVSTDHEDQLNSLETQKEFFTVYAQEHHHQLFRVYADEGISGTRMKNRKELQQLMQDAKFGLFEAVVVKDISRLARNTVDFLQNIRALKAMGIGTIFVTNNMTTLGDSEFILTIFGAMAQEESANLSKRVKFGKNINSQKGRVPPWIYGYDRIDNFTLKINEKEAAVVRDIFDMFLHQGLGSRLIAQELERRGETTKFGGAWDGRTVRRILDNPIYSGHYVNHRYHIPNFLEGKLSLLPEDQHYHHDRPEWAIISPEDFARAQEFRRARRAQYGKGEVHKGGRHSAKHLFSTLIKCECCGRSFYRYTKKRKDGSLYIVWKCTTNNEYTNGRCPNNTRVREEELISYLSEYLRSIVRDKAGLARRLLAQAEQQERAQRQELSAEELTKKRTALERKIDKHMEMYAEGLLDMDALKTKVTTLREEVEQIDQQLTTLARGAQEQRDIKREIERYIGEIETVLSLKTVNNMDLRRIVSQISVSPQREVTIHLRNFFVG